MSVWTTLIYAEELFPKTASTITREDPKHKIISGGCFYTRFNPRYTIQRTILGQLEKQLVYLVDSAFVWSIPQEIFRLIKYWYVYPSISPELAPAVYIPTGRDILRDIETEYLIKAFVYITDCNPPLKLMSSRACASVPIIKMKNLRFPSY